MGREFDWKWSYEMRKIVQILFILSAINIYAKSNERVVEFPRLQYSFVMNDSVEFVKGEVYDKHGNYLTFSKVIIVKDCLETYTNEFGEFSIPSNDLKTFNILVRFRLPDDYYSFTISKNGKSKKQLRTFGKHINKFEKRDPCPELTIKIPNDLFINLEKEEIKHCPYTIDGNYVSDPVLGGKPIIYLYPSEKTEVEVKVNLDGKLTHTYPKYNDSWQVTAFPNGKVIDQNNKEYYSLYWEGMLNLNSKIEEGFVVKGSETINFLEESLTKLGLNRREANEFIIYWLPHLENNPYNLIHFATTDYIAKAELDIKPKPETSIRLLMRYQPLNEKIKIKEQKLPTKPVKRRGFTIVEWGGSLIGSGVVK
jgi:hypothetical protein